MDIFFNLSRHFSRSLIVRAKTVGQARIGVGTDIIRCAGGKLFEKRLQLAGSERAVEPYGKDIRMLH